MAENELDELFETLRGEANRSAWSRGVEWARAGRVALQSQSPEEIVARVEVAGALVTPTAILYPALTDWECDCGGDDPCPHVVATTIACRQADRSGEKLPDTKQALHTLEYAFQRGPRGLEFERTVGIGAAREPLRGTLAAIARGRIEGPKIAASVADLEIERVLGSQRAGHLPRGVMHKLFELLEGRDDVRLDGKPVATRGKPVGYVARLRDDGPDFLLQLFREPPIEEKLGDDLVLAGGELRPLGHAGLSARELARFGQGERFRVDDLTSLVTDILPALEERVRVEILTTRLPKGTAATPRPWIETRRVADALRLLATVAYGDPPIARVDAGQLVLLGEEVPIRDRAAESRVMEVLRRSLGVAPGRAIELRGDDALLAAERLRRGQHLVTGSGLDGFFRAGPIRAVSADGAALIRFEDPDGRGIDAEGVVSAWQRRQNWLPLEGGGFAPLPADWLQKHGERLADLLAAKRAGGEAGESQQLPVGAQLELLELCSELGLEAPASSQQVEELVALSARTDLVAAGFRGELRRYQTEGAHFVASRNRAGFGALLADDMGLGKTVQALASLTGPSLVVAPTSVLTNWAREAERFRPDLRVCTFHGPSRTLDEAADIVLTSYAILRLDRELLAARTFETVILDEAQAIKNPDSQTARAARALVAKGRLALTGTPVENRLEELWSISQFLNPGMLGSRTDFVSRTARPMEAGDVAAGDRLRKRMAPFLLRRKKSAVAPELPKRQEITLISDLDEAERAAYDAVRAARIPDLLAEMESGETSVMGALEALLRLRQACCHAGLLPGGEFSYSSKLGLLVDTLESAVAAGHKALVFSQWTSLLDLVEPALREAELRFDRIDGSTRDRASVVDGFQAEQGPPVLLISLMAGGTGLNLTAADHVFLLDPWWNPAVEDQAADRAHRIGQERPVLIHRLVARDTVEERVLALQANKRALAEAATGGGAATRLERDELMNLLRAELD